MSPTREQRLVIAGASSLLGSELKSLLEESRFASWDFSLVDEESSAGTLTEAAGEATIIQPIEEGSFADAKLIFFTGSEAFTQRNLSAALNSGGFVIDLSGGSLGGQNVQAWFGTDNVGARADKAGALFAIPSAPGLTGGKLLDTLSRAGLGRLAIVFFRPVSEAGRAGIEELESQTSQLLSFQSVGQPVFDTQAAFTLLDSYGTASREKMDAVRTRIRREILAATGSSDLVQPAIQVVHAPVFYGYTFIAIAELNSKQSQEGLIELCRRMGFALEVDSPIPVGNLTASGDSTIHLAVPQADSAQPGTWWFWGAADNVRLPAATAIKLAEKLVE